MTFQITKPGIYLDVPDADYRADPCPSPSLTQSIVKVLLDHSALHAKQEHPRLAEPDEAEPDEAEKYVKAQAIGNAAHAMLIGRGKLIAEAPFDDWRRKEAQGFRAEAVAAGKMPILAKHNMTAHRMVLAARMQLLAIAEATGDDALDAAFRDGNGEVVAAAEADGLWLRSLIDWMVSPTLLIDFKTTASSVAPHVVPNKMADDGWPIQAAMQERILDLIDPDTAGRRRFLFVAQENYAPFALTVHEMTEAVMTMGRKQLAMAEAQWRECLTAGQWPAYPPLVNRPEYPGFKETAWLNREIEHAERKPPRARSFDPNVLMAG